MMSTMTTTTAAAGPFSSTIKRPDEQMKLAEKLKTTIAERESTQARIKSERDELERMFGKGPKRPREKLEALDKKIDDLEWERTINSMDLASEREILRQIYKLERMKRVVEGFEEYDKEVKEKKKHVTELRSNLQTLHSNVNELRSELSTVKQANELGCDLEDLLGMQVLRVPEDKVPKLIGKKGQNVKKLVDEVGVSVDINASEGHVRLHGRLDCLHEAAMQVDKVISATGRDVTLQRDTVYYLTAKHIQVLPALRKKYHEAYINVTRDSNVVRIEGVPQDIEDIAKELKLLQEQMIVREWTVPSKEGTIVVGKSGNTVQQMVSDSQAAIRLQWQHPDENDDENDEEDDGDDNSDNDNDEQVTSIKVIGPQANVERAIQAIHQVLSEHKQVVERFPLSHQVRGVLVMNQGALINALRKQITTKIKEGANAGTNSNNIGVGVGILLEGDDKSGHRVQVKGTAKVMPIASDLVMKEIRRLEALVVRVPVDPTVIPILIGKNGQQVQKIMKDVPNGRLDLERDGPGEAVLSGADKTSIDVLRERIDAILEQNYVERVPIAQEDGFDLQVGALTRFKSREITRLRVHMTEDASASQIVLRGDKDKVQEAAGIVRTSLEENHVHEIPLTSDHLRVLRQNGKNSPIAKIQREFAASTSKDKDGDDDDDDDDGAAAAKGGGGGGGVILSADPAKNIVVVRGPRKLVKVAVERVYEFLHGGKDVALVTIQLDKNTGAVAQVIGRGGRQKEKFAQSHPEVFILCDTTTHVVTLRGPAAAVEACRVDLSKFIGTLRTSRTMPVTQAQREQLNQKNNNSNWTRQIAQLLRVQISDTSGKDELTIRGYPADVQDAMALLQEQLTGGMYISRIQLEAPLFQRVRDACKQSSHLDRMEKSTGATIHLENTTFEIILHGKRVQVGYAKVQLVRFLEFLLSNTFCSVDVNEAFLSTVTQLPMAHISAESNARVYLDRDLGSVLISSSDASAVNKAVTLLEAEMDAVEKRVFCMRLDPTTEDWILALLIGRNGSNVQKLRKQCGCNIDVNSEEKKITVTAASADNNDDNDAAAKAVAAGRKAVEELVDNARKTTAHVAIPPEHVGAFIGRGGSHLREFAARHNVEVQMPRTNGNNNSNINNRNGRAGKGPTAATMNANNTTLVRLQGKNENDVREAKVAAEAWLRERIEARSVVEDKVELAKNQLGAVIGVKGAVIRWLQTEYGCRIDVDRDSGTVTVRGNPAEKRAAAVAKIKAVAFGKEDLLEEVYTRESAPPRATTNDAGGAPGNNNRQRQQQPRRQQQQQRNNNSSGTNAVEKNSGERNNNREPMVVLEQSGFPPLTEKQQQNHQQQQQQRASSDSNTWANIVTSSSTGGTGCGTTGNSGDDDQHEDYYINETPVASLESTDESMSANEEQR